jgi:hypothetical protein
MLTKFDPPAFLPDLSRAPGLLDQWSEALSRWFDDSIAAEKKTFKKKRVVRTSRRQSLGFPQGAP